VINSYNVERIGHLHPGRAPWGLARFGAGDDVVGTANAWTPYDMLSHQQVIGKLRHAAAQMGAHSLREGSWFQSIVAAHVRNYSETISTERWEDVYPGIDVDERARREIERTARLVAATGMASASGASAGELLMLITEGLATPVGLPVAAASMVLGEAYTAFLQIKLAFDLGSIYGAPFDTDDVGEVAVLFGLALDMEVDGEPEHEGEDDEAAYRLTGAIVELHGNDVANLIGKKLLEKSALKTSIPILGIALSGQWNYVATRKLGAVVQRYVRYRVALRDAIANLRMDKVPNAPFIVSGAWLLTTADGKASHDEVRALTAIIGAVPKEERAALQLQKLLHTDQEKWFDELAGISAETASPLLDVLYLIAATDKQLHESERRFLCRVGKVLARDIDFDRIMGLCGHLARGGKPPQLPARAPARMIAASDRKDPRP
jgi:hypothetical protein